MLYSAEVVASILNVTEDVEIENTQRRNGLSRALSSESRPQCGGYGAESSSFTRVPVPVVQAVACVLGLTPTQPSFVPPEHR